MMKRFLSFLLGLVLLAAIGAAAAFVLIPQQFDQAWRVVSGGWPVARSGASAEVRLFGVLETHEVYAMSELAGRVQDVRAAEGDAVAAAQPLVQLDSQQALAQLTAAQEAVAAAQAAHTAAAEGPTAARLAVADSAVAAAQTRLEGAQRLLAQAEQNLSQPLTLDAEIHRVETLLPAAEAGVSRGEAQAAQIQVRLDAARQDGSQQGKFTVTMWERQQAAAQANIQAARARLQGLQQQLKLLQAMRATPLALTAQTNAARQEVHLAEAALAVAQAQAAISAAAPTTATVALAAAQEQAATAALAMAQWQVDHLLITAPQAGKVLARLVDPGETVAAGERLFTIADLSQLEVRVFIPLSALGTIQPGQTLPVYTPAGEVLTGEVIYMAAEAQFRPNDVLNPDDRGEMVFLTRLRLPNPDGRLQPGMPVDVVISDE